MNDVLCVCNGCSTTILCNNAPVVWLHEAAELSRHHLRHIHPSQLQQMRHKLRVLRSAVVRARITIAWRRNSNGSMRMKTYRAWSISVMPGRYANQLWQQ